MGVTAIVGVVSAVVAIAGTAMGAVSSISQGNAQRNAANAQSDAANRAALAQADAARRAGEAQDASFQSQAEAERYNAGVNRQNAEYIKQAGAIEEEKQREKGRRLLGTQQALYGKAGVTNEGTPLEIMASTAADLEKDALTTRYNYDIQSRKQLSEAGQHDFMAGRNISMGGFALDQSNASANFYKRQGASAADFYNRQGAFASTAGYMNAGTSLLTGMDKLVSSKVPTSYDIKVPELPKLGFTGWES